MKRFLFLIVLLAGCATGPEPAPEVPAPEAPPPEALPERQESVAVAGLMQSARSDSAAGRLSTAAASESAEATASASKSSETAASETTTNTLTDTAVRINGALLKLRRLPRDIERIQTGVDGELTDAVERRRLRLGGGGATVCDADRRGIRAHPCSQIRRHAGGMGEQ